MQSVYFSPLSSEDQDVPATIVVDGKIIINPSANQQKIPLTIVVDGEIILNPQHNKSVTANTGDDIEMKELKRKLEDREEPEKKKPAMVERKRKNGMHCSVHNRSLIHIKNREGDFKTICPNCSWNNRRYYCNG